MKKQIITGVVFILVGLMLGFFAVVNWQLAQEITKTKVALDQDSQRLDVVEKYLTKAFSASNEKQPSTDQTK